MPKLLADGKTLATEKPTAAAELERLHARRNDVELLGEADPLSKADDPATWRVRNSERQGELAELEVRIRRLEAWGELVISHEDAVVNYESVQRSVQKRWKYVRENQRFGNTDSDFHHNIRAACQGVDQWKDAIAALAQALGPDQDTELGRASLIREQDRQTRLKWAVAAATGNHLGYSMSWPEFEAEHGRQDPFPAWVFVGVTRGDR